MICRLQGFVSNEDGVEHLRGDTDGDAASSHEINLLLSGLSEAALLN